MTFSIQSAEETDEFLRQLLEGIPADDGELLLPGDEVFIEEGFFHGNGIAEKNGKHFATICGKLQHIGKMVAISGPELNYAPLTGDFVVGVVDSIELDHWAVEVGAQRKARLAPQSVILQSGEQRIKTENELQNMREYFDEGDVLVAEVQRAYSDGSMVLSMRNEKFGLLRNGYLICVKPSLAPRIESHVFVVDNLVKVVLGTNGFVWLGTCYLEDEEASFNYVDQTQLQLAELDNKHVYAIARVRNCVIALATLNLHILPEYVSKFYAASIHLQVPSYDILETITAVRILEHMLGQRG